jgi:2-dehydro-3-deoxyglucarate aldolase/4-hydroxy-2-oxoheptanedioate aldolase
MRENPVKRRLESGETVVGLIVFEFSTTGVARLAAAAGADFVMYDMEHGGLDITAAKNLLASARAPGAVPLVRVASTGSHLISQPLDAGALGVMVPMVESAEQARAIVKAARYPPLGRRGVGVYLPDDAEPGGLGATIAKANEEILVIAQIESAPGVEHVDEIAAVEGIDVLWIGHFDLTTSLGIPGGFWQDAHTEAVDRVLAACARHGKPAGTMANDVADGRLLLEKGFRALVLGDVPLLFDALRASVAALAR